jgi:DNA-binding NarL/FixJ family response regulator
MVDELNRFSDFIVTRIDQKCSDYMELINSASDKKADAAIVQEISKETKVETYVTVDNSKTVEPVSDIKEINSVNEAVIFTEELEASNSSSEDNKKGINHKQSEVIKLFEAGMSDAEIAKALNIGKGEVQLIVGLNIHKIKV